MVSCFCNFQTETRHTLSTHLFSWNDHNVIIITSSLARAGVSCQQPLAIGCWLQLSSTKCDSGFSKAEKNKCGHFLFTPRVSAEAQVFSAQNAQQILSRRSGPAVMEDSRAAYKRMYKYEKCEYVPSWLWPQWDQVEAYFAAAVWQKPLRPLLFWQDCNILLGQTKSLMLLRQQRLKYQAVTVEAVVHWELESCQGGKNHDTVKYLEILNENLKLFAATLSVSRCIIVQHDDRP